jgi:hypothetical protein
MKQNAIRNLLRFIIITLTLALAPGASFAKSVMPPSPPEDVVFLAAELAHPVFPKAADILGVVAVESRFKPNARNRESRGLMMVDYPSHKRKIVRASDLYDPRTNMTIAVAYLRELYEKYRSRRAAIMAYNSGPGAYDRGVRSVAYFKKVDAASLYYRK